MAESLSVRSNDGLPQRPAQHELAGEVKRKNRRLQGDQPPEDLLQRLQAIELAPNRPNIARADGRTTFEEAEHYWQNVQNTRPNPLKHPASIATQQPVSALSDFELSLNDEQLERRLMNYHLKSGELETIDADIQFRRRTPGNEESGRCPFVGTDIECHRCTARSQTERVSRPILPPRNPGPWQRSQWLKTRYTPPSGVIEASHSTTETLASWNFPDPPLPALTTRRIHNNLDHRSGVSAPAGQRTSLRMENPMFPTNVPVNPMNVDFTADPALQTEQRSLPYADDSSAFTAIYQPIHRPHFGLSGPQPSKRKSRTPFWHHELHQLEHRD